MCRSQWPRGLRHRSAAARLLRLWVRIPPGAWIFVCCECCVLSGRGLCDELIARPEESYRLWWVVVCDLETSRMRRPWSALGRSATGKKKNNIYVKYADVICFMQNIVPECDKNVCRSILLLNILRLYKRTPSATTNFISLVNTRYMFRSYWPSSGIKIHYILNSK